MVWSAGNTAANHNWGNRDDDDVIVVGATTSIDTKSSFSSFGHSVDVLAPGSGIYTTQQNSGYGASSGTSFAAPLTAGLIAMIWAKNPTLTPDEVELVLKESCDDLGPSGVDEEYAYGRINSYNALTHPLVTSASTVSPSQSPVTSTVTKYMCSKNQPKPIEICAADQENPCAGKSQGDSCGGPKRCWLYDCPTGGPTPTPQPVTSGPPPPTPPPVGCELLAKNGRCNANSECCSGNCKNNGRCA